MRRSLGYSILGYDNQNPAANQQIRQSAALNLDELGRRLYARLVCFKRGPNSLALVKTVSLTRHGRGGHSGDEISPVPTPRRLDDSLSPLTIQAGAFL